MHGVGVLGALVVEVGRRMSRHLGDLCLGDLGRARVAESALGGCNTGPAAEHDQVRERVATEPVRPVHAAGDLTGGVKAGDGRGLGVGLDADASHGVVARRADLHRRRRDVDVGQLLELVVHRGQPATDLLGGAPARDVEEDAAVRAPPAGLHLRVDRPGDLVAGKQLRRAAEVRLVRRTTGRPPRSCRRSRPRRRARCS